MASTSNFVLAYNKQDVVAGGALSNANLTPTASGGGGTGTVTQLNQGTGITLTPSPITGVGTIANAGVTQIVAGTNVTISPSGGTGVVTVNSTAGGGGTVTSVASGTGLTGGPITTSGTLSIASTGVSAASYGTASSVPTIAVNAQGQITSASNTSIAISGGAVSGNIAGNAANVTGTVAIGNGGTGATTAATARTNLGLGTVATQTAPSGTSSQLLANDGSGGFSNVTVSTGLSFTGGVLTASGTSGVSSITGNNGITPSTLTTGAVTLGLAAITPASVNGITLSGSSTPSLSVTGASSISGSSSGTNTGDQTTITGNAGTATKLATGRTIAITGDLAYTSPSFDGSANVTAGGTLASIVTAAGPIGSSTTTPVVTIDAKGRVTALSSATIFGTLPSGATTSQSLLYGTSAAGWYTEHFNVKAFGATGNGSTDDTSNINLAIAALNAAGGGVLYFPKGQYVVNSTYNGALTTISVPCRIIGDGHGHSASESATAILKYNNGSSNRNVFTLNTSNPANFEDLSIVFNAATTAYGIYLNGPTGTPVDYSTINRVSVVSPSGTSATGVYSYNGNNTRITNCYIAGNAYGIYLTSDLTDADSPDGGVAFITNCVIESNTSAGIYHTSAGGINIIGNQIHSNAYGYRYVALDSAVTSDIIITSNWIDVFTYAISFEGPSSSGSLSNVIIADNSFATLTGFSFSGVNVIQVINGSSTWFHEFNISGNSFQYAQANNGTAITLNNCYNGMIGSNMFFSPSSYTQTAVVINTTCSVIQCQPDQTFYLYTNGPAILDYQSFFGTSSSIYSLASATTITLPKVGLFTSLTGTTNVQTINGGWLSRRYRFIVPSGLSFVSGGNISTPITVGAAGVVDALYDGYTWSLH